MPKPRASARNADQNPNLYGDRAMPYEMKDGPTVKMGNYGPSMLKKSEMSMMKNSIRDKNMKRQSKKSHNPY